MPNKARSADQKIKLDQLDFENEQRISKKEFEIFVRADWMSMI